MTSESILYPYRDLVAGCQCAFHVAERQRDAEQRDAALRQAIYELGLEQLRLAALERVPAFQEAWAS